VLDANKEFERGKERLVTLNNTLLSQINTIKKKEAEGSEVKKESKNEVDSDDDMDAKFEKEFKETEEFEKAKQKLKDDLAIEALESDKEKEELKIEQDFDKRELELEKITTDAEELKELKVLLQEQEDIALGEIKEKYRDKDAKAQKNTDEEVVKAKTKMSKIQTSIASALGSALQGILGKSLAGQIAGIAVDAAIQSASVGIKTSAAQASNLAIATAVGPPANLVTIPTAAGQNAVMAGNSAAAIGGIWSSAGAAAAGSVLKSVKFQDGGYLNGSSHAGGGIDLGFGREAEGGEFISSVATMSNPKLRGIVETANAVGNSGQDMDMGVTEERVAEIAASIVGSIPVVVTEYDITDTQKRVSVQESEFNG
jgi:hypothetical protein